MIPSLAGIGPLGTTEILIIAVLFGILALGIGGIIFLIIHLSKKQK